MCLLSHEKRWGQDAIAILKELEAALKLVTPELGQKNLRLLKSRLLSDDFEVGKSVYIELKVVKSLKDLFGSKTTYEPLLSTKKRSDIKLELNGKTIYFEVGVLRTSLAEKKISEVLEKVKRLLLKKIETPCGMRLEVDTAQFVFDAEGHVEVEKSASKLTSELDEYQIHKLAGAGSLSIPFFDVLVLSTISIYDRMSPERKERLVQSSFKPLLPMDHPKVAEWAELISYKTKKPSRIIKNIIITPNVRKIVEIHPWMIFPSKAATLASASFVGHIKRHLKEQNKQLEPGTPNIIVIQGDNWTVFGLENPMLNFNPIYEGIKSFFDETHVKDLSGVALFTKEFIKSRYISNEYAVETSKLDKSEISRVGFCWFTA